MTGLRVGGIAALVALAFSAAGVAGGWILATRTEASAHPVPEATVVRVPTYIGQDSVSMPEVRGLSVDDAEQVLADAGIPATAVHVQHRVAAADPGTVADQRPTFGTAAPASIVLTVSDGAVVPAVIGTDADVATTQLEALGTRVQQTEGYDATQKAGAVLAVEPAAGRTLPAAVTLTVNGAPTSRYLATLRSVDGGCSTNDELVVGGDTVTSGLECGAGSSTDPRSTSWLLRKAADRITGSLGIGDDADQSSSVHVRVLVDRRIAFDRTVQWGSPVALDLDTQDALRLTVEVWTTGSTSVEAALADVRLVGGVTAMSQLPAQ
ncbi:PASTA domain-containing protein [uncultured Amnibacterium sp.]|uniref:PASTA domain-containing protein n=1 Tax=uncultured Amnibacterium sp. TaxID=1631851 RepID=UPI0035C9B76A